MANKTALIITSIAEPNNFLQALARGCREHAFEFIVIGDESSPPDFQLDGCRFYGLAEQRSLEFQFVHKCPTRHYARKNIGYLIALRDGASVIVETDDDNSPKQGFWNERIRRQCVSAALAAGWVNVYRYFTDAHIWPRGLPLDQIHSVIPGFETLPKLDIDCPIQQGLVSDNPDVDALYRLVLPLPQEFRSDRRLALANGSWCPFNSQNTTWWREVAALLYLPAYCSFRMTDIWRSFVAQRISWVNDWAILFHEPTLRHDRNTHNLLLDFEGEVPGYLHNRSIGEALDHLNIIPGVDHLGDNLKLCYEELVRLKLVGEQELGLLDAWLNDIDLISQQ